MVCGIAECVDFELLEQVVRHFVQEPVQDHASFDPALRVQDEDNLFDFWSVEGLFDEHVALADVGCVVAERTLDKALDYVENNAASGVC
jgi:hypothetical protein